MWQNKSKMTPSAATETVGSSASSLVRHVLMRLSGGRLDMFKDVEFKKRRKFVSCFFVFCWNPSGREMCTQQDGRPVLIGVFLSVHLILDPLQHLLHPPQLWRERRPVWEHWTLMGFFLVKVKRATLRISTLTMWKNQWSVSWHELDISSLQPISGKMGPRFENSGIILYDSGSPLVTLDSIHHESITPGIAAPARVSTHTPPRCSACCQRGAVISTFIACLPCLSQREWKTSRKKKVYLTE